ncbi:LacI family DNA-binding transcriptional regulator [Kribbella shirazensis]|uniref:LacI family transcriptional regulator n=1 Tax=Kribbella shirazensis TaxID=1105143 RepID=A0A7X5VE96_9ACTN|nr:LacI family DNA-binding transcriptional regulator [Kribbella shirazensis]NIK59563.1 LacI family transcriptional regulator [Kribbella shirazensis]
MSSRAPGAEPAAPTITNVAALAGVSRATVSRAFSNPRVLRPETVTRVREIAAELGYVPNPTAKALSTGRHGLLAMIVPDIANPFFPPMIGAAQGRAETAGLALLLGNTDEDPAREHTMVSTLTAQADGFVLAASRMTERQIRSLADRRPVVLVNRDLSGLPRVLVDSADGVRAAVEHLAELGHTRIAYLAGPTRSWANTQRKKSVKRAAERAGVEAIMLPGRVSSYEAGMQAAPDLLETGATAAVAFDDVLAHGIMAGLAQHGISVPGDISLVGCDDVLKAQVYPPLTTVSSHAADAGAAAVDLLVQHLADPASPERRVLLGTSLIIRATTVTPH